MKSLRKGFPLILVILCADCGSGKYSGLQGKVVDGQGAPIAGVKIVAKQVQPIEGYERLEATTGSDGIFRFKKLFPSSAYELVPWARGWETVPLMILKYSDKNLHAVFNAEGWASDSKLTMQAGPEGEIALLVSPMVIQRNISIIEGKVVDAKGKPIPGIKVIGKQNIKGYEQFETTTEDDGRFRLSGLYPERTYRFFPISEDWANSVSRDVITPAEEQTASVLLQIRFTKGLTNGVITDLKTGLEWYIESKQEAWETKDIDWHEARSWTRNLSVAHGGWRMPTRAELKNIHMGGLQPSSNSDPFFEKCKTYVWSGETEEPGKAWCFYIYQRGEFTLMKRDSAHRSGAIAVRWRSSFAYHTPDGWTEVAATQFRNPNFVVGPAGEIECYVSVAEGTLLAHARRWRLQMGLEPFTDQEFAEQTRIGILGHEGVIVDFEGAFSGLGTPKEGYRLLGALVRTSDSSMFIKMIGPKDAVDAQKDSFMRFAQSLRVDVRRPEE